MGARKVAYNEEQQQALKELQDAGLVREDLLEFAKEAFWEKVNRTRAQQQAMEAQWTAVRNMVANEVQRQMSDNGSDQD